MALGAVLTISAAAGFDAIVKLLLDEGADMNSAIQHGYTPVILAVSGSHYDVACVMLQMGAQVDARANPSWTSLFMAVRNNSTYLLFSDYLEYNPSRQCIKDS